MKMFTRLASVAALLTIAGASGLPLLAVAQPARPGDRISGGSPGVLVEGRSAARSGDRAGANAAITGGSRNVFIGGKPAARAGDRTSCGGIITGGSSSVFVNGKPLAATGDRSGGC
jgi:uncharacterized Zn-binding protein involved in type VI secretion